MKVSFRDYTSISEVTKFNIGITPRYGKGTMKGVAWCTCGKTVCDMILCNNRIVGWFETECDCKRQINWSDADKYL